MRLIWADALKGFLILLVILGHAIQYRYEEACFDNRVWCVVYSFHMPCFIAISGYFAPSSVDVFKKLAIFIIRRFRQLIVPMVCWEAIIRCPPPEISIIQILSLFDCGGLWFLWALFFICIIYYISLFFSSLFNLPRSLVHGASLLILVSIMVVANYKEHGFQYVAFYYPFYLFGFYIKQWNKNNEFRTIYCYTGILIWFVCALFWKMHDTPSFLPILPIPQSIIIYIYRYIVAFIAVFSFWGLASHFLNRKIWIVSALGYIGGLSLGIYSSHLVFFKYIQDVISSSSFSNTLVVGVSFFVASLLSIIVVSLINQSKSLSMLLLGRISYK